MGKNGALPTKMKAGDPLKMVVVTLSRDLWVRFCAGVAGRVMALCGHWQWRTGRTCGGDWRLEGGSRITTWVRGLSR